MTFITREYSPLFYYWELIDVARKLFLTGFVLLIPQEQSFVRLIAAVFLSICYLVLLTTPQPYKQRSTALVAVATQLSLVSVLFAALLVKVDVDNLGELAAELGVTSMPTFLFFRSGEMIDSMRGADEDGLRMLVAEHAKAPVPA